MIMFTLVSVATNIFDVIITFMFFNDFLHWKSEKTTMHFICALFMFAVTLVSNQYIDNFVMQGIITLVMFLAIMLFFGDKIFRKILVVLGYMAIIMTADIIITILLMLFLKTTPETLLDIDGYSRMIAMVASKPIVLFLVKLVSLFKNKNDINVYTNYWLAILTVPLANVALLITIANFFYDVTLENVSIVSVAIICILYINILIFYLFDKIIGITILKDNIRTLENQITFQSAETEKNKNIIMETDSLKHDLKNHFQTIYMLNKLNERDKITEYLKDTGLINDVETEYINTGNPTFDAVLNSKIFEAEQKRICIQTDIKIPENIKVTPIDMSILFGNLLDNAIEACDKVKNSKYIHIVVEYKDRRLIICIQNSADNSGIMKADKGIGFISSKSKDGKHGIGINNIYNIVRKYDGMCKFMPEKTTFTVYISLFDI